MARDALPWKTPSEEVNLKLAINYGNFNRKQLNIVLHSLSLLFYA